MADSVDEQDLHNRVQRIELLLQQIQELPNPAVRGQTQEIVQTLLDMHGSGLAKIVTLLAEAGASGQALIARLTQDELVSSLLLLYGLHPVDLETRVRQALEKVRPYLHGHGGNVELVGIHEGIVRLKMLGSCHGCPSSAMTLKNAIEEAVYAMAPDVTAIEVEEPAESPERPAATFVPVEQLLGRVRLAHASR